MSKTYRYRSLVGLAIIVATVLLPPIIFGSPRQIDGQSGGDSWRNFIFDFQTLLTGFFAVGAAAWTVITMEKTDFRSEARHQQLVAISLRSEIRAIERSLNPQVAELEHLFQYLWDADYDVFGQAPNANWDWYSSLVKTTYGTLKKVGEVVHGKQMSDSIDYFDGHLLGAYNDFLKSYSDVIASFGEHLAAMKAGDAGDWSEFNPYFNSVWEDNELYICSRAVEFVQDGQRLLEEMKRVRRENNHLQKRFSI